MIPATPDLLPRDSLRPDLVRNFWGRNVIADEWSTYQRLQDLKVIARTQSACRDDSRGWFLWTQGSRAYLDTSTPSSFL